MKEHFESKGCTNSDIGADEEYQDIVDELSVEIQDLGVSVCDDITAMAASQLRLPSQHHGQTRSATISTEIFWAMAHQLGCFAGDCEGDCRREWATPGIVISRAALRPQR